MEKLHNHSGQPSMLVLRPADTEETTVAWRLAMENTHRPTGLILSRQDVNSLPVINPEGVKHGAYIVEKDENHK